MVLITTATLLRITAIIMKITTSTIKIRNLKMITAAKVTMITVIMLIMLINNDNNNDSNVDKKVTTRMVITITKTKIMIITTIKTLEITRNL